MTSSDSEPGRERVPPGQRLVTDLPVLQAGTVAHIDRAAWSLTISGLVEPRVVIDCEMLTSLPATEQISYIHCVTDCTKLDTAWKGVRVSHLLEGISILPYAKYCVVHAANSWTTNLPLEELLRDYVLVAYEYDGRPISAEHGGPVRLLVPRLYLWKSAKWLTGI